MWIIRVAAIAWSHDRRDGKTSSATDGGYGCSLFNCPSLPAYLPGRFFIPLAPAEAIVIAPHCPEKAKDSPGFFHCNKQWVQCRDSPVLRMWERVTGLCGNIVLPERGLGMLSKTNAVGLL